MIPEIRAWILMKNKMVIVNMMDYQLQEFDWYNNIGGWLKWEEAVFMLFSEMVDGQGNKIWEGDIVRVESNPRPGTRAVDIGEVIYDPDNGGFKYKTKQGSYGFLKNNSPLITVIGNIHENKEALNS